MPGVAQKRESDKGHNAKGVAKKEVRVASQDSSQVGDREIGPTCNRHGEGQQLTGPGAGLTCVWKKLIVVEADHCARAAGQVL